MAHKRPSTPPSAFRWNAATSALTLAKMDAPLDIRWSRPVPDGAMPSTVTVRRDTAGRYFVMGSCHGTFLNTLEKVETPPKLLSGQNTIAALPMMLERATSPKLRESPCAARLSFMM